MLLGRILGVDPEDKHVSSSGEYALLHTHTMLHLLPVQEIASNFFTVCLVKS